MFTVVPKAQWKDIICGDSPEIQIPGGWGASGQPNDGWHSYLHLLNKAYSQCSVSWSSNPLLRKCLDEINLSPQGSTSTKSLACIVSVQLEGLVRPQPKSNCSSNKEVYT